ncbi:MAG: proton-conducting transporter membrane subunit [Candidatus Omnitrophota bacterium]
MKNIFQLPWQVPFGEISFKVDPLSLLFLICIFILVACSGIYAAGYLQPYKGKKPLGAHIFFYCLLVLALVVIVTANNVILFLGAWETMSIAVYFLIIFDDEQASVRRAGFLYLAMAHCGTFLLFIMFFLLSHAAGSMNFDLISRVNLSPVLAGTVFILALFGFGVKAGFLPVHIWLPHAHPAAPAHVSALLSGVAIKIGIYGICRVLWMVGVFPDWCGYMLLMTGVVSGIMGVLYALGQHELKQLLAYHSIENIGIIALGLGVGLLGRSYALPLLATIGFAGGLLHVLNHSIFKGLLFLGAGSVIQKTHTGQLDQLGGLAKSMPITSALFLVGALAICGLPLFNGFISEFIIFFGLFQGLLTLPLAGMVACVLGILFLALMGALALACFTKVYGTVFLGKLRKELVLSIRREASPLMIAPMLVLAGLCIWIGFVPKYAVNLVILAGEYLSHVAASSINFSGILVSLSMVNNGFFIFLVLVLFLIFLRRHLLKKTPVLVISRLETWSCGFSQVTSRFQYTSSSFAHSILDFVKNILFLRRHGGRVKGDFPLPTQMHSLVRDAAEDFVFRPLFSRLAILSKKIDDGRIRYTQIYLMYIFLFLIFLLVWKMR